MLTLRHVEIQGPECRIHLYRDKATCSVVVEKCGLDGEHTVHVCRIHQPAFDSDVYALRDEVRRTIVLPFLREPHVSVNDTYHTSLAQEVADLLRRLLFR